MLLYHIIYKRVRTLKTMSQNNVLVKENAAINSKELEIIKLVSDKKMSIRYISQELKIDYKNCYRYVDSLVNKGILEIIKKGKGFKTEVTTKEQNLKSKILKLLSSGAMTQPELKAKLKNENPMAVQNTLLSLSIDNIITLKWEILK